MNDYESTRAAANGVWEVSHALGRLQLAMKLVAEFMEGSGGGSLRDRAGVSKRMKMEVNVGVVVGSSDVSRQPGPFSFEFSVSVRLPGKNLFLRAGFSAGSAGDSSVVREMDSYGNKFGKLFEASALDSEVKSAMQAIVDHLKKACAK